VGSAPHTHWGGTGSPARGGYGYNGSYVNRGATRYHRQVPYLWPLFPNYYDPFLFGDSAYDSGADYNSGYVDPGYGDPNAYGAGYEQPPPGPDPQTAYLEAQVQQLSNQLSASEQQGVRVPMAPQTAPSAAPAVPITLVLRDGRHLQVQNYAVMDQMFWDFTTQPVKKIPLTSIDVAASEQLSAANGADFPKLTVSSGSGR
jgi:hypothetical protein